MKKCPKFLYFTLQELFGSSVGSSHNLAPYSFCDDAERVHSYMMQFYKQEYCNMCYLVRYYLDPIRGMLGFPITVTSSYRSLALNKLVGGVPNSYHLFGCAFDLVASTSADFTKLSKFLTLLSISNPLIKVLDYGKYLHLQFKLTKEQKDLALGMFDDC